MMRMLSQQETAQVGGGGVFEIVAVGTILVMGAAWYMNSQKNHHPVVTDSVTNYTPAVVNGQPGYFKDTYTTVEYKN